MGKKIKLRRCTAFTIAFALIVSLFPNALKKVYAANDCRIEVSPENDGHVELQDDYTIGYLDEDKNCIATYKFLRMNSLYHFINLQLN